MENHNILLITNNSETVEKLASKLVLLRCDDTLKVSSYDNYKDILKNGDFKVVLLHENGDKELTKDVINYIKSQSLISQVILILDEINYEFILNSYDLGVKDYFLMNANPAEILIKVINAMKVSDNQEAFKRNYILLKQLDCVSDNDFYTEKFGQEVIENELDKQSVKEGHFVVLTYDEADKEIFNKEIMAEAIKSSLRMNDIVVELKSGKYYIILSNSDFKDIETVINKIKDKLKNSFKIKAGVTSIKNRSFAEIERKASAALTDAMLNDIDFAAFDENNSEDMWVEMPQKPKKDYKLFKQIFSKKLEKVIAPVFFRLQKTYEEQLTGTKIEQYTDELQSVFSLRNENLKSRVKVVYPGLGKVIIIIKHEGLDSPENREISIPMSKVTQKDLTNIIEDFIKEYILYTVN